MISLFMAVYIDTSFFLSIIFEDTNYELSYESWIGDDYRFSSSLLEIESFINIHKIYRENRKVLSKVWLTEKLTRQKDLLSEIHLKRIGSEIYEKIRKNEKLTFLKSLDSIHLSTASLIADVLKDRITICTYDKNIRKIASDMDFKLCEVL
ncbi:PIN domain protein [Leptospira weilii str. 2006001853]|uniref:PIN domain protein n=2 Tax=Leptospiraceae TaxID=170 RepID=A0A828Z455_9LEPT|nr:PIN domain protein [Leptospira weilii str. 2006001853]EMJ66603.1 PIN domain protein [Leptospira sp. P2653]EMN44777.1 PIN domain protein [Leptospira weilii str. LNT 1234]